MSFATCDAVHRPSAANIGAKAAQDDPDAEQSRHPVAIEGSEFQIEVDTVILAMGQGPIAAAGINTCLAGEKSLGAEVDRLLAISPGHLASHDDLRISLSHNPFEPKTLPSACIINGLGPGCGSVRTAPAIA